MDIQPCSFTEREERLGQIAFAYLQARERGRAPNPQELLTRHPEFAEELVDFLEDEADVEQRAAPLRELARLAATGQSRRRYAPAGELPPTNLKSCGDHELLSVLAQGGMGLVYKARQRSPNRLVALKMIRSSRLASDSDVRRFRNEAETIAQLDHPHIVPIYEVGEEDGQLYFSMKLMEGGSLTEHLPRFQNDPRATAQLMVNIARAVHHAHQRGVLHRDLKPSNILLDAAGHAHVTDFGLAKRLEGDGSLTETGAIVGMPCYMSPEQATGRKGPITTATDVYGLGTILYALLTGRPPFQDNTPLDTLAQVQRREPDRPSGINRQVDLDLETICLKCLQKDPNQRYASADALADDLQRWLAGEPIQARPISTASRVLRWCRRRPVVAVTLFVVALLLAAVIVIPSVMSYYLVRSQAAEQKERELAEQEHQRAEVSFRLAWKAWKDLYPRIPNPWLTSQPGLLRTLSEYLQNVVNLYERLGREDVTNAEVRYEAYEAYFDLGGIQIHLGQSAEALQAYERARYLIAHLIEDVPGDPSYRLDHYRVHYTLATALDGVGRRQEAEAAQRQALETIQKLSADYPNDSRYRDAVANQGYNYACMLRVLGKIGGAEEIWWSAKTATGVIPMPFSNRP
jgi:serine/threonine-protein kinase